jgi:hypothetical protein
MTWLRGISVGISSTSLRLQRIEKRTAKFSDHPIAEQLQHASKSSRGKLITSACNRSSTRCPRQFDPWPPDPDGQFPSSVAGGGNMQFAKKKKSMEIRKDWSVFMEIALTYLPNINLSVL